MKISELLQGIGSPIAFYPDLVPLTGSHHAAIFLCQLTYWHGKQSNPAGWIYKTQEEWRLETELSDYEQRNARMSLVSRGLLQERYAGIPRRLEYRLKENALNKLWDCWQVACKIKKEFKDLNDQFGNLISRGFGAEEIKLKLENYRSCFHKCRQVAQQFFKQCRKSAVNPITKLNEFEQRLKKVAETLEKSIISQTRIMASKKLRNKVPSSFETGIQETGRLESEFMGDKVPSSFETGIQEPDRLGYDEVGDLVASNSDLPESVIIDVQAFQAPSESTAENTAEISSKITAGETTAKNMRPGISISGVPPLKNFQEEPELTPLRPERGIELPKETQKNPRPEEGYRAKPKDPHEGKFSAAAAPDFEKTPDWVEEIEEKVRQGKPLQRDKLIALANYRLGDSVRLYRHSGEIFHPAPGDISGDFVKFVQWYSFNGDPNVAYVQACILKFEKQPENWPMLQTWVSEWQAVLENPLLVKEMLSNRVASQGKKASGRDFDILNELAIKEAFGL
ncbi:hypothetical protein H6G33_37290 [Calothrix sp. FACHB-1219]|uniref:hypothetical protein n=1 Tax=unclassified Calothrix TaxID=2619626 RepID=UPI001683DB46|nr:MULTISPECIES: hypothetical protein [unclassified Calothrix]MBD2208012.1 hypothetical protein [Calothrix sp. FACHB-168]MBD2222583.1 hypothetical protein [Calothrix sp. FACHB-1219]